MCAMSDPFSTTYQGAQQGFGAFGQALTQLAEAKRQERIRQQEMQLKQQMDAMQFQRDLILEREKAKLRTEYVDPLTALFLKQSGQGLGQTGIAQTPDEALKNIPQGEDAENYTAEPIIAKTKGGIGYTAGYKPKLKSQTVEKRQEKQIDQLTKLRNILQKRQSEFEKSRQKSPFGFLGIKSQQEIDLQNRISEIDNQLETYWGNQNQNNISIVGGNFQGEKVIRVRRIK